MLRTLPATNNVFTNISFVYWVHIYIIYAQKHNRQASPGFECDYIWSSCNITQVESVQSAHNKMVPNMAWAQYSEP